MEDLGKEVDEYFAKKHPLETKKVLCHQCGGVVDKSLQQLRDKITVLVPKLCIAFDFDDAEQFNKAILELQVL